MKAAIYTSELIHEVIGLAWADEISFDEIKKKLGLTEAEVINVMRSNLKPSSFRAWRKRVTGRKAKHLKMMRPKSCSIDEDDVAI